MSDVKLTRNLALSESGFVFLPTTGETFTANETGRMVLAGLQSGKSEAEILQSLHEEFDADPAAIERDVSDFITQLREYRLLSDDGARA
jgi:PqqD family protein of HPr-rel-A system